MGSPGALASSTGVPCSGTSLDSAIRTVAEGLNDEVLKVQKAVKDASLLGNQATTDYEITHIQEMCLAQLKQIANDPNAKESVEILEKNLATLKQTIQKPYDFLLREAMVQGSLDLAHFAIVKGADPLILEDRQQADKLSGDALKWLALVAKKPEKTPQFLDHYALSVGFGYKAANLELMDAQLQNAAKSLSICDVKVPSLKGISHFEMMEFIKSQYSDLEQDWTQFLNTFDQNERQQFESATPLNAKDVPIKISPQGEALLKEMRRKIENCFTGSNSYSSLLLQQWLQETDPQFVIVRSSGKEDSDVAANAGGNKSIPFITPSKQGISDAVGEVIASYFSVKSITQRLQSGDQSVFTEKPFVPVLVQEMIAEPNFAGMGSDTLDIPRSGVLFTRQPGRADECRCHQCSSRQQ